ncbi:hypothetical protein [Nitrosomonas sp.]|uniref:hypothetical protein n=1 Tax=Nitrosomonas sp. TaxID=42353 RepID=UPI00374D69AD
MSSLLKLLSVLGITIFACSQTMAAGYSSRTHNYAIEYLKPKAGMGDISIINITVNRKITASEAERLLKEEIQKAAALFPPKGELMAYAWIETNTVAGSEEMIKLPDGSNFLIYSPKTKKAQTEKQYDISKQKPPQAGKGIKVDFSLELERGTDGRVRILGTTNLPHGMTLMTGLRKVGAKYFAQDNVEVINGRISTTWFSDGGKALSSGAYEVRISSPLPALQSTAVRDVIGQMGENLSGPITTSMGSKMIDLTFKKDTP